MDKIVKVLLVEDLESDALLAEMELKKILDKFILKVVDNAKDLTKLLTEYQPDLVLSDYNLPSFNGMEALRIVKRISPIIPVIIFTGSMNEDIAVECMKAGATDYVIKERIKRLGSSVQSALQQREDKIQKREAQRLLRESEKKYRRLYETMAQGVIYHDLDGRITSVNPSAERILGAPVDQLLGKSITSFYRNAFHEDGFPLRMDEFPTFKAIKTRQRTDAVIALTHPDFLNQKWLRLSAIPEFLDGEDKPYQVYISMEEITELKEVLIELNVLNKNLEEQVEQRTKQILDLSKLHQSILDHAGKAIVATTENGVIWLYNQAAEKILGYDASEVIGISTPLLFNDRLEIERKAEELSIQIGMEIPSDQYLQILSRQHDSFTDRCTYLRKDGSRFPSRVTISAYSDSSGTRLGYILIFSDITAEVEAHEELKRNEERFEAMFRDHAAVMLLVNPEDGRIQQANRSAKEFYGYDFSPENNINIRSINQTTPNELMKQMELAKNTHRNNFVFPHRLANGEIRTVEIHSSPIEVSGEKVLFSIIHDITERKIAEEKLIKSEQENKAILDAVPDILFKIDADGIFQYAHFTGVTKPYLPRKHFMFRSIKEVLPEDVASLATKMLNKALKTKETVTFEYSLPYENGIFYFENRMVAISDNEILSIIRDITKRKLALEALQKSESFLKMMTNTSPLAFLVVDNKTDEIIFHNPKYCEIWGICDKIKSAKNNTKFKAHIEICKQLVKDPDALVHLYEKLSNLDDRSEVKETFALRSGNYLLIHSTQIRGPFDENFGRLFIFEDITEKEKLANSLKDAVEHERKLSEVKSRFVSMASHEFRTPIASILMASETLLAYFDRMNRADMDRQLHKINNNIQYLRDVIEMFLDLSKIETGKISINPESFRLNDFIHLWYDGFSAKHSLQHNLIFKQDMVQDFIIVDKQLMTQVMDNLVSNSMKYSPLNSDIVIQTECIKNNVVISITDQGMGIPEQDLEKMFQPFFRASNAKVMKGTGLGLPLCKEIIEHHKGRIWIESKLNIGTKVCFTLPVKKGFN